MMLAGEDAASCERVHHRAGIAARDENAFARIARFIPQHRDAMRGVLAGDAEERREKFRPDVFEADQADADDRVAFVQLRTERFWKLRPNDLRVGPKINENAPSDGACE